jgi:hypothetical protein
LLLGGLAQGRVPHRPRKRTEANRAVRVVLEQDDRSVVRLFEQRANRTFRVRYASGQARVLHPTALVRSAPATSIAHHGGLAPQDVGIEPSGAYFR